MKLSIAIACFFGKIFTFFEIFHFFTLFYNIASATAQFGGFFDYDGEDADLGLFVQRSGSTVCKKGSAIGGLPTEEETCGDGEVCQVTLRHHRNSRGVETNHYHCEYLSNVVKSNISLAHCVKENVCQVNMRPNVHQCSLYPNGRKMMAQRQCKTTGLDLL